MINVNKLLMSAVIMTAVVIKAEEAPKSEVVAQEGEFFAELKNLFKRAKSQENIDTVKEYTNKGLEQTEKVFTQYPMYIPAAFFFGRATMAGKVVNKENLPKDLTKPLKRTKIRNMYVGLGLLAGHFYYNRNEQSVKKAVILENKTENVTLTNQPVNGIQA